MEVTFYKYQGTGNDFIIIDNRNNVFPNDNIELVNKLCDRKFGIGADGLILIEPHDTYDFNLVYFNSDGSKSFCGNGSRCGIAFAKYLGIIKNSTTFYAIDGVHKAKIINDLVHLKMNDITSIEQINDDYFLNTGSPHYIIYKNDIQSVDIINEAHAIRYNDRFKAEGTNVNFVEKNEQSIAIRTYERGVEDETLSCGTGATAAAISAYKKHHLQPPVDVFVEGGKLTIDFEEENNIYSNIWLIGPAKQVFKGSITI